MRARPRKTADPGAQTVEQPMGVPARFERATRASEADLRSRLKRSTPQCAGEPAAHCDGRSRGVGATGGWNTAFVVLQTRGPEWRKA